MSFLPDWMSQGVQGQDNNGGFGTAAMFNQPDASQQGDVSSFMPGEWDWMKNLKLADLLKGGRDGAQKMKQGQGQSPMPQMNRAPSFTPYQEAQQVGPNMGQRNNPDTMSPNGQIMPNWNRTYGGY